MRAAQIHKTGALELNPATRIQRPKPTRKAEIAYAAAFSMLDSKRRTAAGENVPARARKGIDF
jgi:hypothetical protein